MEKGTTYAWREGGGKARGIERRGEVSYERRRTKKRPFVQISRVDMRVVRILFLGCVAYCAFLGKEISELTDRVHGESIKGRYGGEEEKKGEIVSQLDLHSLLCLHSSNCSSGVVAKGKTSPYFSSNVQWPNSTMKTNK